MNTKDSPGSKRKYLACPACSYRRLIDVGPGRQAYAFIIDGNEDRADLIAKCKRCKKEIGISFN
jgi:DNA-directed RNA polymerase subunit RPC12/RpoP